MRLAIPSFSVPCNFKPLQLRTRWRGDGMLLNPCWKFCHVTAVFHNTTGEEPVRADEAGQTRSQVLYGFDEERVQIRPSQSRTYSNMLRAK